MRRATGVAVWVLMSNAVFAQAGAQSVALARELVRQLDGHHLEAIAAVDSQSPDRVIAALYVAPSQLLVVGAQHPASEALRVKLAQHQYRDVYVDLQTTPVTMGKWFVHDIGADGLSGAISANADNVYESGTRIVLVNHGSVQRERFARSDAEYARMLRVLLDSLRASTPSSPQATSQ